MKPTFESSQSLVWSWKPLSLIVSRFCFFSSPYENNNLCAIHLFFEVCDSYFPSWCFWENWYQHHSLLRLLLHHTRRALDGRRNALWWSRQAYGLKAQSLVFFNSWRPFIGTQHSFLWLCSWASFFFSHSHASTIVVQLWILLFKNAQWV